MALVTSITLDMISTLTKALDLGVNPVAALNLKKVIALASGVAANQADKLFIDERTIAASGTDDLDLAGSLLDPFGDAFTPARIKALVVVAEPKALTPVNTNNVVIGGAPSSAWVGPFGAAAHTIALEPGNIIIIGAKGATAWPVTATSADLLRIANSGAGSSVIYQIALLGAST